MYTGKIVFAQLIEFLPMHEFHKCVKRYRGNYKAKNFSCLDQFLSLSFAQLTYRESLRDIESCLRSMQNKLYHMGIRGKISRSTLADANENRDWHIYADFAQILIHIARNLYHDEELGIELEQTIYALDSTTIDLCLSLFPWARFRKHKAGVKMHTLLDLRGSIPSFIRVTEARIHDVNVLDDLNPEAGSFYIMDRAYLDFARLYTLTQHFAFFVIRAKSNLKARRLYSRPVDKSTGLRCDQTIVLTGAESPEHYPEKLRRIRYYDAEKNKKTHLSDKQLSSPGAYHRRIVQMPVAGGTVFQMDQAASADQSFLWDIRECCKNTDMDSHLHLCAGGDCQKASQTAA